jgi:hypothetical protein
MYKSDESNCSPRVSSDRLGGNQLIQMLLVAHKYCMETIEGDIIKELKKTSVYEDYVDLVAASNIIGSEELCQDAVKLMVSPDNVLPTIQQARRMGVDVAHTVMQQMYEQVSMK